MSSWENKRTEAISNLITGEACMVSVATSSKVWSEPVEGRYWKQNECELAEFDSGYGPGNSPHKHKIHIKTVYGPVIR
jgi:hypothetical protein